MFYYCDGDDVSDVLNKTDCMNKGLGYRWVNQKYNFDNLGQVCRDFFATERLYKKDLYIKTTLGINKLWSWYTGGLYMQVQQHWKYPWGPVKCGLYKYVVFIYR